MNTTVDSYQDIIDTRDVIERIDEIESAIDDGEANDEERKELENLINLREECQGYSPDWSYGATLIRDSYFQEYAQDLAEDIGAINHSESWPNDCIDWELAARELQIDYTSVEFCGVTYWIR